MNKQKIIFIFVGIIVLGSLSLILLRDRSSTDSVATNLTQIRIGWQTPWATQGQLTQILKHTDILKNNNIAADFKGFSYGGPLNEAALANEVDIIFTADQPAATLLAKEDDKWIIIGRLMYNRVSLYVPPMSSINSVADLKGKTVAMPFGAAAQRMALKAEQDAGLNPKIDVNNINLGIYEQSDLVRDPNAKTWGNIDAMAGFDPTPAIFEEKGLVRNLKVDKVVSVILVSNNLIERDPASVSRFLKTFNDAYDYYRNNISQADSWFVAESGLDITPRALEIAADIEPNLKVASKDEIRIGFNDEDYKIMQEAADFIFDQGLVKKRVIMKDHINTSLLEEALK
ncbi:MAG: ABC transporter substrate-binding protein [Candidatus Magasanikbacteria bacterium]|nr:ABC transporter substrate-binding protein [Candidatus Magasanikbacteria bacterium]NCS71850.1 ABC transporter substrate-binding protein [Candidatus Magasanikbacteria bacterium]